MRFIYEPGAQNDFIWATTGSLRIWLIIWLVLINFVTFFVFGIDKLMAKRKEKRETIRRVPERTLFLLAAAGGSVGALLGMKVWRHKTLHKTFRFGIPAILVIQLLISVGLYIWL